MLEFFSRHGSVKKLWASIAGNLDHAPAKRRGPHFRTDLMVPAVIETLEKRAMLSVVGVTFNSGTGVLAITGTTGNDAITVAAGGASTTITVNGAKYQTITGATSANLATINFTGGGGAADSLAVTGITGNLTVGLTNVASFGATAGGNVTATSTSAAALNLTASTIGGNFSLTANSAVTDSGKIAVTGTTTVTATGKDVSLSSKTNTFGGALALTGHNVAVNATGAVAFAATTATGTFAVTSTGAITDTAAWTITGTTTLNAGASTILLTHTSAFTGAVGFTGSNASMTNSIATVLGASALTGNLTVTSTSGAVTNTGKLVIGGITTITATGQNVSLSTSSNSFTGHLLLTGANVTVGATGAVNLGLSTATGNLVVTASGAITDSGVLTIGGTSTFNAGTNNITLTQASAFTGAVGFIATNVAFKNTAATVLGTSTLKGNLTVNEVSLAVTTTGVLNIAGTTSIDTTIGGGSAAAITLGAVGKTSAFGGAINLNATNATVYVKGAVILNTITATGTFTLAGTGAVTNTGVMTIGGALSVNVGSANNVTLSNAANSFTGQIDITGNNVAFKNTVATVLDAVVCAGTLTVNSTGAISKTGSPVNIVNVKGTSSFTTPSTCALVNYDCIYGGAISASGTTVTFEATGPVVLGTITATGALGVYTDGGSITNTGTLTVGGLTTMAATALPPAPVSSITAGATVYDVSLNKSTNTFAGAISIGGANVTVAAAGPVNLGLMNVHANLAVTAAGAITDSGVWTIGGTTTLNAGAHAITLAQLSAFTGAVNLVATNAAFVNTIATVLGSAMLSGTLTLSSTSGAVTNSGKMAIGGITTIDATGNNLSLSTPTNTFGAALLLKGINVTVNASSAVALGTSTVTGNLSVKTTGAITDTGVQTVTGTSTFNSGTTTTLTQASHYTGALSFIGATATVTNAIATVLGASTLTGNLTVTSAGAVTNNGKMVIGGTTTIGAGAHDITLNNATNAFTGAMHLNGVNVTVDSSGAVVFGTSAITGNFAATTKGSITDNGALTVTGTTNLNVGSSNNITLTNAGSTYTGTVALVGNNVSITSLTTTDLGAITTAGTLTVVSGAAVTDSGLLTISGTLTITANAGAAAITLSHAGNVFKGAMNLDGNPVTVS